MKKSSFKIKIISRLTVLGLTCLLSLIGVNSNTSALTYQENVDVNFTLLPAVSISLSSSDLIINNLTPGQNLDSNIITLTAASNSPAGYTISSTVGNSTDYTTTNLKHSTDTSATPAKFTSLATTDSIADLANLTAGYWGYSYSLDHGEHWINATKTGDVNNPGYSGLPLYTTETPTELLTVSTSASSTLDFKIAAAATATQASGEYNNVINFIAVAAPMPTKIYMQDLTSSSIAELLPNVNSSATVYDKRDEQEYTIAKLADNNYWMTSNMKLGKGNGEITTLTSTNSDLPPGVTFDLKASGMAWDGSGNPPDATGDCNTETWMPFGDRDDAGDEYYYISHLCINTENPNFGTYYNYYTATAGTGTFSGGNAVGSICPKGWKLPPNTGNGSYSNLFTAAGWSNFSDISQPPANFLLSGITRGEGILTGEAFFWSSTASGSNYVYGLSAYGSHAYPSTVGYMEDGYSVRCLFNPSS